MHVLIPKSYTFPNLILVYISVIIPLNCQYSLLLILCHMSTSASCDTAVSITLPPPYVGHAVMCARHLFKPAVRISLGGRSPWGHSHRGYIHTWWWDSLFSWTISIRCEESQAKCMFCHVQPPFCDCLATSWFPANPPTYLLIYYLYAYIDLFQRLPTGPVIAAFLSWEGKTRIFSTASPRDDSSDTLPSYFISLRKGTNVKELPLVVNLKNSTFNDSTLH